MTENKNHRRVVITGLGCVSSLGIGKDEFWKNLVAGKNGISRIEYFDTSDYDRHFAGEIKGFDYRKHTKNRMLGKMGRASQMAYVAAQLALEDAGIDPQKLGTLRVVSAIGTTMGEPQLMEVTNSQHVSQNEKIAYDAWHSLFYSPSMISENLSLLLGLKYKSLVFANACCSGNVSMGYGYDMIRKDQADYALVGGADALSRIAFSGFSRMFAVAPELCQPFDKNRQGMIPGEGAAILILESLESARKRKALIYGEILGYGTSSDANHMTQPKPDGVAKAIAKAIRSSRIKPEDIDYISAHGTGTKENDKAECEAFYKVLGERLSQVPVNSIKSMLGHTMGAASAFESISCCLTLQNSEIPPTINHSEDDPECPINCVPNKSLKKNVKVILNNSQAFGGNNCSVILTTSRGRVL